jgi:anthranilate synthase/aminodeoxychorismate synthase-like glutamine amidotransferase
MAVVAARVVMVDNYDSFTYNLVQQLGDLGAEVLVFRNDAIDVAGIAALGPTAVVVSPGPGRPETAGISMAVVAELGPRLPILGVCLGHQCIGAVAGAAVVRAPEPMHGKTSAIHHGGRGILGGLPDPFTATRYHSLVLDPATVPAELAVTARTADGVIMAVQHRTWPVHGVQFHPESVLSPEGPALLANFLRVAAEVAVD